MPLFVHELWLLTEENTFISVLSKPLPTPRAMTCSSQQWQIQQLNQPSPLGPAVDRAQRLPGDATAGPGDNAPCVARGTWFYCLLPELLTLFLVLEAPAALANAAPLISQHTMGHDLPSLEKSHLLSTNLLLCT